MCFLKISKSFMDFAIKYKNPKSDKEILIMVESKSKDNDYDVEKTNDLLQAYDLYMEKFNDKNLYLVLHKYHSKDHHEVITYIKGEKVISKDFEQVFRQIINL